MSQATPTVQNAALSLDVQDNIAIVTFDTPNSRANTMGQGILLELEQIVDKVSEQPGLQGLIFRSGKPGMFIAGADLKELGAAMGSPEQIREVTRRGLAIIAKFEAFPFPTVALIDGACMGGGTELALGFDYRLAGTSLKVNIGLPEIKVGLIPGWGGTQRMTRLIGPNLAAELICSGDAVNAQKARDLGIVFDVVPSESMMDEAKRLIEYANESGEWNTLREKKRQPIGLSEEQLAFTMAVVQATVLGKTKGQMPAPLAALEAIIKGANLTLEEGLKIESEQFAPLVGSTISRNLIALFFMDQKLSKDPGVQDTSVKAKAVERVGVIGAGIMGAGIAGANIRRGVSAFLVDKFPEAVDKGVKSITKSMEGRVKIGRMTQQEVLEAFGKLNTGQDVSLLADRDVVVEAIIENEEAKIGLFQELQKVVRKDAIIASNTSTISITRMAESVENPERFAGMHFFNPVDRMRLVEVIRGAKTSDETVVTLVALAKRIGKTPIVVRDCPGFLVNRILFPYMNEALALLEEGASPRKIDKAATIFGMPMGPITLQDVVGLDTSLYAGTVVNTAYPDRAVSVSILQELVDAGRLGQKTGAGFYKYTKGSRGEDDPALEAILGKCRKGQKEFNEQELTDRLFLPMLAEATRVLSEEIVRSPEDLDMGLILGIGFPPFRGGILRWADILGMKEIVDRMAKYESLGQRFRPTDMMKSMAAEGKRFYPN
ncbi:MAG: 3-hydroxyacyl-CoA dehydrogenase NAD-binding domain-containing protein [Gemmataceae bacterium]